MELVTAPIELATADAEQTRALARAMAPLCLPGDIVLLAGDLGAGKTTFAQGFAAGLGIDEVVTSPTFMLVRQYPVMSTERAHGVRVLIHADVYRLDHLQEIADLGLGELVEDGGVALVEWGDAAARLLGEGSLAVGLVATDADDHRSIVVRHCGGVWTGRWGALVAAVEPWRASR
jgi:tRNA threonylcarbamoyladenosine biosynthesis protein TsaE